MGVICHCERNEAISQTGRLAQSWLMPSAYRFVATLLAMTAKNLPSVKSVKSADVLSFFAIIKPPGHKRSDRAAKGTAAL